MRLQMQIPLWHRYTFSPGCDQRNGSPFLLLRQHCGFEWCIIKWNKQKKKLTVRQAHIAGLGLSLLQLIPIDSVILPPFIMFDSINQMLQRAWSDVQVPRNCNFARTTVLCKNTHLRCCSNGPAAAYEGLSSGCWWKILVYVYLQRQLAMHFQRLTWITIRVCNTVTCYSERLQKPFPSTNNEARAALTHSRMRPTCQVEAADASPWTECGSDDECTGLEKLLRWQSTRFCFRRGRVVFWPWPGKAFLPALGYCFRQITPGIL